ncbi:MULTISPECIES: alpha/beta fold hydrolase [unclassified Cryobacterium]|uniref:alpha/beta fold hydrolase n=1 Tax=unclassified Cryobacterium TaxID=2649013 RepID=UPI002AB5793A|nr:MULTISPECIES: alpha/beta fold hydrolase [unclassified Cryobacterium]MDY7543386.1 alpha/beta fold hydrolase [Cryobacterium sp. 5B3]MEA9999705.1 alpha/beta fold hydrolase [Cryobacterium sp. RTS3]MEB0264969.1 alpha/beta fold hydrolase [Cryobacterium sp. 10I5]MEB0274708.1 alpha/beta fold hydrolase [Cryobacterium sp. 5B3]
MGFSTAVGLTGNADVVTALCSFLDHLDAGPALLLGHSYGAYLARGVAARRPDAVRGLALVCPGRRSLTRTHWDGFSPDGPLSSTRTSSRRRR